MISRSDWEPLPTPTLSPFARGYLSLCRLFFTAAVWCVPALRVPLVHSLINHFRQKHKTSSHVWRWSTQHVHVNEESRGSMGRRPKGVREQQYSTWNRGHIGCVE